MGEQLLTPLTAVTVTEPELITLPIRPITLLPIRHETWFTGTTLLGNTTTTSLNHIITNHHWHHHIYFTNTPPGNTDSTINKGNDDINRVLNDDQPLAATPVIPVDHHDQVTDNQPDTASADITVHQEKGEVFLDDFCRLSKVKKTKKDQKVKKTYLLLKLCPLVFPK